MASRFGRVITEWALVYSDLPGAVNGRGERIAGAMSSRFSELNEQRKTDLVRDVAGAIRCVQAFTPSLGMYRQKNTPAI